MTRRVEAGLVALVCAAFVGVAAASVAVDAPFEYDEAVYAVKGRAWAGGGPESGWAPYRGPALPVVGAALWRAGARSHAPYRVVGVAAGVIALVLVWRIGRRAGGPGAGVLAAAGLATVPELGRRSAQFLTDVPGLAVMLALTLLLWRALADRAEPDRRLLLWVGPLASLAYAFRYGLAPAIAIVVAAALVVWRPRARPRDAIAAGAVALAAFVPHLVYAVATFGEPWGPLTFATTVAQQDIPGRGWGRYLTGIPVWLGGPVAGVLMLAGIWWGAVALVRRRPSARAAVMLVVVPVVTLIVIGAPIHAQKRYALFPVALLVVAGSVAVTRQLRPRAAGVAALAVALVVGVGVSARDGIGHAHASADARMRVQRAAEQLAIFATRPCSALATGFPQVAWVSGCVVVRYDDPPHGARTPPPAAGRYVLHDRRDPVRYRAPVSGPGLFGDGVVIVSMWCDAGARECGPLR